MGALVLTAVGFVVAWFIGRAGGDTTQTIMLVLLAVFGLGRAFQVCMQNVAYHPARSWGFWWVVANVVVLQFGVRVVLIFTFLTGATTFGAAILIGIGAMIVSFVAIIPALTADSVYVAESNQVIAEMEANETRRRLGF